MTRLKQYIMKQVKAGVIPYYIDNGVIKMLFMIPSDPLYGGSDYQIAKGTQDYDNEFPIEIAKREGQEELGLKLDNILGDFTFAYKSKMSLYDLYVYIARIKNVNNFDPFDKETGKTSWLTIDELPKMRRDQQQAIQNVYDIILSREEVL